MLEHFRLHADLFIATYTTLLILFIVLSVYLMAVVLHTLSVVWILYFGARARLSVSFCRCFLLFLTVIMFILLIKKYA